jgi:hypothetical protein
MADPHGGNSSVWLLLYSLQTRPDEDCLSIKNHSQEFQWLKYNTGRLF